MSYVHPCFEPRRRPPSVWSVPQPWAAADDKKLMEGVADGETLAEMARRMGRSKNSVVGRFNRLAASLGWQAA